MTRLKFVNVGSDSAKLGARPCRTRRRPHCAQCPLPSQEQGLVNLGAPHTSVGVKRDPRCGGAKGEN
jgi:hypothetical protein